MPFKDLNYLAAFETLFIRSKPTFLKMKYNAICMNWHCKYIASAGVDIQVWKKL